MALHEYVDHHTRFWAGGDHQSTEAVMLGVGLSMITLIAILHFLTGGFSSLMLMGAGLNIGSSIAAWWTGGHAAAHLISLAMVVGAAYFLPKLIYGIAHHDFHHPGTKKEA